MVVKMKKYFIFLSVELKKSKEYLINTLVMISMLPIQIAIYLFLVYWLSKQQMLKDIQFSFFMLYYIGVLILKSLVMPAGTVCYYIFNDIRTGKLDRLLLLPVSYIRVKYIERLSYFLIATPIGFAIIFIAGAFLPGDDCFSILNIVVFFISSFLGFSLLFLLFAIVGILSFWFENILSLRDILWIVLQFFTGETIPLFLLIDKFPIFQYLPTSYIYYYPIILFQGKSQNITKVLVIQLVWVTIFIILSRLLFRIGINKYESQGG